MVRLKKKILGNEIPKESTNYTCITCITTDFVIKIEKKSYWQFCHENIAEKLSASLFGRVQIQNNDNKND